MKLKVISLLLSAVTGFSLYGQRCLEFDKAIQNFNTYFQKVKHPDGSISVTDTFQKNNTTVIEACNNCLKNRLQAGSIKNRLVFTYTLGLHHYYDSKFELAIDELSSCLQNPRSADLLPATRISYADASRNLMKEMSCPRHGSGIFTLHYSGKAGLIPELLVEHGKEDSATRSLIWSDEQLFRFSKLSFKIKDSLSALHKYKTLFPNAIIEFNNPVLITYHERTSSKNIDENQSFLFPPGLTKMIADKHPALVKAIRDTYQQYKIIDAQPGSLQDKIDKLTEREDSLCLIVNKLAEVKNSSYAFVVNDENGIVFKKRFVHANALVDDTLKNEPVLSLSQQLCQDDDPNLIAQTSMANVSQNSIIQSNVIAHPINEPATGAHDLYIKECTDILDLLSAFFRKKYTDSLLLTIHIVNSSFDTTEGWQYFLETAGKLNLPGPKGSLGYFNPVANSIMFWEPSGKGTLAHELAHAYLNSSFNNCPLWLNEGIAGLFEELTSYSDSDFVPADNWRLIYITEYYKHASQHIPLSEIFSDTVHQSVVKDVVMKCYARYFCIYLKEKQVLAESLLLIHASPGNELQTVSNLLQFKTPGDLQNDWEQWLNNKGYGINKKFNNTEYIKSVDNALEHL